MPSCEACLPNINGATEPQQRFLRNKGIQVAVRRYKPLQQEFSLLKTNIACTIPCTTPGKALITCQPLLSSHIIRVQC